MFLFLNSEMFFVPPARKVRLGDTPRPWPAGGNYSLRAGTLCGSFGAAPGRLDAKKGATVEGRRVHFMALGVSQAKALGQAVENPLVFAA